MFLKTSNLLSEDIFYEDVKLLPISSKNQIKQNVDKIVFYEEKFYRHQCVYEHFFKVRSHSKNSADIHIEPTYIDGKYILRKSFLHYFAIEVSVPISYVKSRKYVIEAYFDQHNEAYALLGINPEENYFSRSKIKKFVEIINEFMENGGEITNLTRELNKNIPFKHWKNIIDPFDEAGSPKAWVLNIDIPLFRFYEIIEKHREFLAEKVFGPEQMEAIGYWAQVFQHFNEIYDIACLAIGSEIKIKLYYDLRSDEHLIEPVIDISCLKTIHKSGVFRVFLPDRKICLRKARILKDWGNNVLPSSILGHIQAGNHVRVLLSFKDDTESWGKDYFKVLKRLPHGRLLAARTDEFSTIDENIICVIESNSIFEIPLTWSGNENLLAILPSLTPPRDNYNDDNEEDPSTFESQLNFCLSQDYQYKIMTEDSIPITYDGLSFQK